MTGHSLDTDRVRALAAGFDVHTVKPVDVEHLNRMLETN